MMLILHHYMVVPDVVVMMTSSVVNNDTNRSQYDNFVLAAGNADRHKDNYWCHM